MSPTAHKLPSQPEIDDSDKTEAKVNSNLDATRNTFNNGTQKLIRNVTFFGDSAIPESSEIYQSVWKASKLLAQNGYYIVNGGGPGIMKAATDGAESIDGYTIAVYWQPKLASFFEGKNLANVTDESESQANYLVRTFGLIEKGDAYIVCKGGTGTISEFGMVWALAKLYYGCHKPVILYGDFWDELVEAFQKTMNIDEKEMGVLYRADNPKQLLEILEKHEQLIQHCKLNYVSSDSEEKAFVLSRRAQKTVDTYSRVAHEYETKRVGRLPSQAQIDEFMSLVNPPAKILDLGTGPGYDAQVLSDKYTLVGVEPVKQFADIAKFENPGLQIVNSSFQSATLDSNSFKGVWARDSLHHIEAENLPQVFAKIADVLVEDGILYVIVREGQGEFVETEQKTYGEVERFYHLFTAQDLIDKAESAGLKLVKLDKTKRSHDWLIGVFRK